jgi:predicted lactoylglutathione lyase
MGTKIFVNLPVKSLGKSMEFFSGLGFTFNPQFTDETAACMMIGEDISVMLLTEAKFKAFTPKAICDAKKNTEVLVCLSADSRAKVDEMVRKAVTSGGSTYNEAQDYGFMYSHGFQDLDGHIWEIMCMEPGAVKQEKVERSAPRQGVPQRQRG